MNNENTKNVENESFNKNEKQSVFNEIKGVIKEINETDSWCSLTISCGHENPRFVNISLKKQQMNVIRDKVFLESFVSILYYPTSRFKNSRWYSSLNLLDINVLPKR